MGHDEERRPRLLREILEGLEEGVLGTDVEPFGGLVEHEQRGPAQERPGDERALALPSRQRPVALALHAPEPDAIERPAQIFPAALSLSVPPDRTERYELAHRRGKRRAHGRDLWHEADPCGPGVALAAPDLARERRDQTEDRPQQRGLARAVRSDDEPRVARGDLEVDALEHDVALVAHADTAQSYDRLTARGHGSARSRSTRTCRGSPRLHREPPPGSPSRPPRPPRPSRACAHSGDGSRRKRE